MVTAAIFDIDGTLIDSVDAHAHAWQDAFADFGHEIAFDAIRSQIGKGGDQLLPVFLSDAQRFEIGDELEAHRGKVFKDRYLSGLRPFARVPELIGRLRDLGFGIALASSAKKDELQIYKKIAGIEDLIDVEASSADAERSKPHPDIFAAAMRRLGNPPPVELIAIGDTPYDAEAAGKLGIRTIGMLCGGFAEADLRQAGCVAIYHDPADLLQQLDHSLFAGGRP